MPQRKGLAVQTPECPQARLLVEQVDDVEVYLERFGFIRERVETLHQGEVRGEVWSEIDREAGVWTIPANRMKAGREHRVPLCGRAVEILDTARKLDDKRLRQLLEKHKIAAVPYGFRSNFDGWGVERSNAALEVIDLALAQRGRNKTRVAHAVQICSGTGVG